VVLTDRRDDGSVIRGESLTHERATPDRPEARTIVSGQPRPHATFRPRGSAEAAPGDTATLPFEVDADWMEIRGESRFTATGNVEISRGATRSGARGATFDQAERSEERRVGQAERAPGATSSHDRRPRDPFAA